MLGPQICVKCRAEYDYEKINEEIVHWFCPKCGETESQDYALTIPEELFEEIYGTKWWWKDGRVIRSKDESKD